MKEFEGILQHNQNIKNLDAVVGFLRASGYFSLRPFLDNINRVRILIGIDVDKYIAQAANQGRIFFGAEEEVREECLRKIRRDIESSNYKKEVEDGMFQMIQDLIDGKLELRAHPSKKIHAKLYILYPDEFNQYSQGVAITGSSNLSGNGLGISEDKQYEFNVKLDRYDDVKFAKDEFELLWKEAEGCAITAEDVKTSVDRTYLKGDVKPYDLYIKMLMEYFSDRVLATDDNNPFDMPEGYTKYDYQMDAVAEGYQKLIRYDGFFLADVVGLGKTVIATMIAKKFLIENGRDKTKILVVYPPAVEQNWKATFKDFGIDKYAKFVTNGSLSKVLDEENYNYWNADEYDLILVDEAHKFRSHTTSAFEQLQEICKMPRIEQGNIPGYKKKVMLISATPMNNTPADIYNEIQLFQDPRRCTIDGVANLTAFFSPLIKEFQQLRKDSNFDVTQFKKLAEHVRDRVIKPLTVRRTRTDIESVARYNKDVNGFPKVERPNASSYELNEHLADLFESAMQTLDKELTYARYQAIAYLKPEVSNGLYDNAELISRSLAGIRKNGLVKRLESSFYAFQVSLSNFRQANQNMLDMFNRDKVFIAPDLDINNLLESGYTDEEIEEKLNAKAEDNPKNSVFKAEDFKPEFIEMLQGDQETLEKMCKAWEKITDADDSKFAKFKELLKHELFKEDRNPEQKLVVFSESVDTVKYLERRINRKDVLVISADNRSKLFKTIRENFDANYKTKLNDYNIILTTDVLAEGVNLHRANVIVNYDTPWNSTRLMQRIGRVNRIGSASKHIYNYVFYPSREGNREINLNQIALSKIQTFHSTFGEDNQIYSQQEILDRDLTKLFDEGMKKQKEEANQELPFYEELRTLYKTNRREYNRIEKLSLRSRTGREKRTVEGVTLSGDTLVFLKTNYRKVFFLVSETAKELSVLDALKYFKASKEEQPVERIEQHHKHINMALQKFRAMRDEEMRVQETSQDTQTTLGAQVSTAVSLLNNFIREIDDNELYLKVVQLKTLAERGVITYIPKRLQRIQKDLRRTSGKSRMTHDEALAEIIEMAKKYSAYYMAQESQLNEQESNAEIILSESFK
ncbi:helicase-related protein [Segatella copri]|uniref:Phospholipase D-like domain-containing protein n=1 Tax=Segatella copri TaxID=165179 RepID=A0AAW5I9T8_9BACT|nr:helicase-related protein [Segatella copri]MCP9547497.1 phospholipase D-like domain-containing protein [Segatella copri]MCP9548473.1 phospholipase D-like domain-containing protein [Segatella copri]MCP9554761.1 phospholipase D-like domain-containing protein [Segatella copri]MCP9569390.1 phospholipase D-like domain-containing protein [Segatella copri]